VITMTVLPPACIGHWYTSMLYLAPVAGLVGLLAVKTRLDNRRDAREARTDAQPRPVQHVGPERARGKPVRASRLR
jgi:hypothetical protein